MAQEAGDRPKPPQAQAQPSSLQVKPAQGASFFKRASGDGQECLQASATRRRSLPKKIKVETAGPDRGRRATRSGKCSGATPSDGSVGLFRKPVPTDASKVGSTVNVLTAKDIEKQSRPFLQDYLETLPGVNVSQRTGRLRVVPERPRRQQSYIKVLVDGIDISDPAATETSPPSSISLSATSSGWNC